MGNRLGIFITNLNPKLQEQVFAEAIVKPNGIPYISSVNISVNG
jgi:hypothetical protein